jgi:F0F1-type ATP synthase assembly protein I
MSPLGSEAPTEPTAAMPTDAARPNERHAADPAGVDVATELTQSLRKSTGSFELALAPVLMALIGIWLDRTLGTMPIFTIGLAVVGIAGAAVSIYYSYDRQMRRLQEEGAWTGRAPRRAPTEDAR